jgi:hypothetical protein
VEPDRLSREAHPDQSAGQPLRDAPSSPAGGGTRDDVLFAATVSTLVLTVASTLTAAFGPGNTARVVTLVSLIFVGLITAAVLLKQTHRPHWRDLRHRPRLLAGTVVLSLALVAVVVVAVPALTAESWQKQADGICWDYGNQYLAARGTTVQQARSRLAVSQQALSALEQIDVPLESRPQFNTMLYDKRQIIAYLRQEVRLAAERNRPSASMGNSTTTTTTYTSPTRMPSG